MYLINKGESYFIYISRLLDKEAHFENKLKVFN